MIAANSVFTASKPTPPFPLGEPVVPGAWGDHLNDTLVQKGNDVIILRKNNNHDEPEILRLEDFSTDVVVNFPGHEQEMVDYLLNNRAYYGLSTLLDAGLNLIMRVGFSKGHLHRQIFTTYDISNEDNYVFLGFSYKGWSLYLNGSDIALYVATWDNLIQLNYIAEIAKEDIYLLEIQLALKDSKSSQNRVKTINKYTKDKPYAFDLANANKVKDVLLEKLKLICHEVYSDEEYPVVPEIHMAWTGGSTMDLPYLVTGVEAILKLPDATHLDYIKEQIGKASSEFNGYIVSIDSKPFKISTKSGDVIAQHFAITKERK